MHTITYSLNRV